MKLKIMKLEDRIVGYITMITVLDLVKKIISEEAGIDGRIENH